ncbi:MAG: DUF4215 domain-containing protein [Polyangiaceae bacterium]
MNRAVILASFVSVIGIGVVALSSGCNDGGTSDQGGAGGAPASTITTTSSTSSSNASTTTGTGCTPASCDDAVDCTMDSCAGDGSCLHLVGTCPSGSFCDLTQDCVGAPACAMVEDCKAVWANDPCKTNIACDGATSTCSFVPLDKDGDGHPPVVCGGDDCDDLHADAYPGASEPQYCDGIDHDCDGKDVADTQSNDSACGMCGTFCSAPSHCMNGHCECTATTCGPLCVDLQTDQAHCGSCVNDCGSAPCVNGNCNCGGQTFCPAMGGYCADLTTEFQNCGTCGHICMQNEQCDSGKCCLTGQKNCGGMCTSTNFDNANCGTCGHACTGGLVCSGGNCVMGTTVSASASTGAAPPQPFCGDGTVDAGEQCDDFNNQDGDGCSSTCMIE